MPDDINELIAAISAGAREQLRLAERLRAALKDAPARPPGRPPAPKRVLPEPPSTPHRLGTLEPDGGYRPPPGTISKVLADEKPAPVYVAPGKRALQDVLAEAVKNTAKLPRGE